MLRNIGVVGSGQAVLHDAIAPELYRDKYGADGEMMNKEHEKRHGSSRIPMFFGKTGEDIVINFGLEYEDAGATLLYTHGYRLSQLDQRTDTENTKANNIHYRIVGELGDRKKDETGLVIPVGSYGLYGKASNINVEQTKRIYEKDFDKLADHKGKAKWYMQEAANNISEVIGLSHVCEQRYLPYAVSLQSQFDARYGLVIDDPHYGYISYTHAMKIIEEKTGGYPEIYFVNCGPKRVGYEMLYKNIVSTPSQIKFGGGFPNDAVASEVAYGCEFHSYDDLPHELNHDDRHIEQIEKYDFIDVVGNCCGTTPEKTRKLVSKLHDHGYTVGNNF